MEYRAEMGFSHHELLKGLPSAVHPYSITRESERVYLVHQDDRTARIQLGPERVRTIASISLPVTDVEITFDNFNEQEYGAFMGRFRKYLQRGGG